MVELPNSDFLPPYADLFNDILVSSWSASGFWPFLVVYSFFIEEPFLEFLWLFMFIFTLDLIFLYLSGDVLISSYSEALYFTSAMLF